MVALLPLQNIKVRVFVPETRIGLIHYGDEVRVTVDGVRDPFIGKVSYISPRATVQEGEWEAGANARAFLNLPMLLLLL
jgi:multidrug resistance efflux pump